MSEESQFLVYRTTKSLDEEKDNDEADLQQFQLRRTWESRFTNLFKELNKEEL